LFRITPPLAACLVLMTTIGYPLAHDGTARVLSIAGLVLALLALAVLVFMRVQPVLLPSYVTRPLVLALIGLGIGMFSGSAWVAIIILLTSMAYWIRHDSSASEANSTSHRPWPYEAAVGLAVVLTLYTMIELRGALPIG
jgi:hypothetical protein